MPPKKSKQSDDGSSSKKKSKQDASEGSDEKEEQHVHVVRKVPLSSLQDEVSGWELPGPKAQSKKKADTADDDHGGDDGGDVTKGLGAVVDGVWFNWTTDISAYNYTALQNTFLAAQLEATKYTEDKTKHKSDKWTKEDMKTYFDRFHTDLSTTGWLIPAWNITKVKILDAKYTVAGEAVEILASILTDTEELEMLKHGLEAMKNSGKNKEPIKLFGVANTHVSISSFAIASVREFPVKGAEHDGLTVTLGMGYVEGTKTNVDILWDSWESSKVDMYYYQAQFQLVDKVYKGVADTLEKKLGDKAKKTVADWKL